MAGRFNIGRRPGDALPATANVFFLDGTPMNPNAFFGAISLVSTSAAPQIATGLLKSSVHDDGQMMGAYWFRGTKVASVSTGIGAGMQGVADGLWSNTSNPGRLEFHTTPVGSTVFDSCRAFIDNAGKFQVGADAATAKFTVDQAGTVTIKAKTVTPPGFQISITGPTSIIPIGTSYVSLNNATGASITLNTSPITTATAISGQRLTVTNSGANNIVLQNGGTLNLGATTRTLTTGDSISFIYDTLLTTDQWCEVGSSISASTTGTLFWNQVNNITAFYGAVLINQANAALNWHWGRNNSAALGADLPVTNMWMRGSYDSAGGMGIIAGISAVTDGAMTASSWPGRLEFKTTASGSTTYDVVRALINRNGKFFVGANENDADFSVDQTGSVVIGPWAIPKFTIGGTTGNIMTQGTVRFDPSASQTISAVNNRINNPTASIALITVGTNTNYTLTTTSATIAATPTAPLDGQLLTILMSPSSSGTVTFTDGSGTSTGLSLHSSTVVLSAGQSLQLVYSATGSAWCQLGVPSTGVGTTGTSLTLSSFLSVGTTANIVGNLTIGPAGSPAFTFTPATGAMSVTGISTFHDDIQGVGGYLVLKGSSGGVGASGTIKLSSFLQIGEYVTPGQAMVRNYNSSTVSGITEAIQRTYTQYRHNMVVPGGANTWNVASGTVAAGTMVAHEFVIVATNTGTNTQGWMYKVTALCSSSAVINTQTTVVFESNAACGVSFSMTGSTWNLAATGTGGVTSLSWHVYHTMYTLDT